MSVDTSRVPIKRNSTTHLALMYLKMKNAPVSPFDLHLLAPKRLNDTPRARQPLARLVRLGLASVDNDMYTITPSGLLALPLIAAQQKYKISE